MKTFFILFLFGLVAFTSCKKEELAHINIQCNENIHYRYKSPCVFQYIEGKDSAAVRADIKRRGGISINYLKYSYSVSLRQPLALCGMADEDDWILNANYIDKTFMRHKISYDLFRQMNEQNIAPASAYVILNLNNSYNGLYVLMEKMNANRLGLNKKDSMSMIFKDCPVFYKDILPEVQDSLNYYQQEYPDKNKSDKTWYIKKFHDFLMYSNDNVFTDSVSSWIDINNVIDWNLLLLFTNNGDGVMKNFFLYKQNDHAPFRIALWDYDHSFGRDGDNTLNMWMDINEMHIERNILLTRLTQLNVESYNNRLAERYFQLRKNVFTEKNIEQYIKGNKKKIEPYLEENFTKWRINETFYKDDNNFEEEITIFSEFVKMRLSYLDTYFTKK